METQTQAKFRLQAPLDSSALAFIGSFCAYAISTKSHVNIILI